MEPNSEKLFEKQSVPSTDFISGVCPTCHQPVFSRYYFCPNCGAKLNAAPLETTPAAQFKLYAFSIILPWLGFLFVTRWQGMKYIKSNDLKTKQIGQVAWTLIVLSTILLIVLAIIWTRDYIQSTVNGINSDLGSY